MQKIESTIDNKRRQKESIFNSSSTVFWCIANKEKKIDTIISFLNHFLLKRNISSVSMRLSLRNMDGGLLVEKIENINEPKVYSFSVLKLLENVNISKGEFSLYIEFSSSGNLAVPFCAVTSEIVSPRTFDIVHTYGRALECSEYGSKIDFETSYETGWCIWNFGSKLKNHLVFHNGRLHSNVTFELSIFENGNEFITLNKVRKKFNPFESFRILLEDEIIKHKDKNLIQNKINKAAKGSIDVKIKIDGLKSTFPRLLYVCTKHDDSREDSSLNSFKKINFTHSNFDFDRATQPKSKANYGYINNPKYPSGIESGFRYYPCKDLENIKVDGFKDNSLPLNINNNASISVLSDSPISSRLIGSNWSIWDDKDFIKDCSTGTFIIEYEQNSGFWHWGRLIPKGRNISSILSLINPFANDNEEYSFKISVFDDFGKCFEKTVNFKGPEFYLEFPSKLDFLIEDGSWYSVTGENVGKFNIFSTCYFDNLNDGTTEHSF